MASIRDVAKKANVGPATVSRVLNNSGYVSEESRRRIEQAMMELDYTPNELARNLFRKKTGIVALLVPSISHPFFAAFVEKAEEALHSRGYKTMLCNTAKEENAELLIDHAWGYEPVTMDLIKAYKPETNSIGSGQVLHCPSDFEQAKLIVREMTDMLVLQLVEKRLVTSQIVLTIGYDIDNLKSSSGRKKYQGEIKTDRYGRKIPKHGHGTVNLDNPTSSTSTIMKAVLDLYERITDKTLLIRRVYITANQLTDEKLAAAEPVYQQMNLFTDYLKSEVSEAEQKAEKEKQEKERKLQEAMLSVKKKFGKNAILKGSSLQEGSTTIERNNQIGGHRA